MFVFTYRVRFVVLGVFVVDPVPYLMTDGGSTGGPLVRGKGGLVPLVTGYGPVTNLLRRVKLETQ